MGLGKRLKKLLDEKHMTVAELSQETGIPATTLYTMISKDYEKTSFFNLSKMVRVLDCKPSDLMPDGFSDLFSPENLLRHRSEILKELGDERSGNITKIEANVEFLNDDGVKRLADYSDDLVSSGKYDL